MSSLAFRRSFSLTSSEGDSRVSDPGSAGLGVGAISIVAGLVIADGASAGADIDAGEVAATTEAGSGGFPRPNQNPMSAAATMAVAHASFSRMTTA
jgi:hypothetical protein